MGGFQLNDSLVMVAGKLVLPLARPIVDGPIVEGSNGSLKVIWMVGVRETPEA